MARNVYSTQILVGTATESSPLEATLDPAFTWVIRDIAASMFIPDIGPGGSAILYVEGIQIWEWYGGGPILDPVHHEGRWVVPGGSLLQLLVAGATTTAVAYISGYQLTLP